jgi:putative transposase
MREHEVRENQNQSTTVILENLRETFLQDEEREAANLFRQVLRQAVRAGLYESMAEEVEALCGPRHWPDEESARHRAGSEKGVAYLDGG